MRNVQQLASTLKINPKDIENWLARNRRGELHLWTEYQDTIKGRSRLFTKPNAIELFTITEFVRCGAVLADAVLNAKRVLDIAEGHTPHRQRYMVFAEGEYKTGKLTNNISDHAKLMLELDCVSLRIVDVKRLLSKVDELFKKNPEADMVARGMLS